MRQSLFAICLLAISAITGGFVLNRLEEYGKAGYYADSLHGRKTASGEPYNKNDLTCAHKSLPYGTMLKVTRMDNNKSVTVRVNDRGPFIDGYVVDVSRKAAEAIGLIKDGVTRVKVEVIETSAQAATTGNSKENAKMLAAREEAKQIAKGGTSAKALKPATYSNDETSAKPATSGQSSSELFQVDIAKPEKKGFGIQVSTLSEADNVLPNLKKLQNEWPGKALVLISKRSANKTLYKLIIGPFSDKKSADAQQKVAVRKGYKKCFVVDLEGM